jgi:hypothetical protein
MSILEFNQLCVPHMPDPVDPERTPDDPGDLPVDLVGWATGHRLTADEPVSPELARELLSTALGVRPAQLSGLSDTDITAGLERLRSLVRQIQRLSAEAAVDDLTGALRQGRGRDLHRRRWPQTHQ